MLCIVLNCSSWSIRFFKNSIRLSRADVEEYSKNQKSEIYISFTLEASLFLTHHYLARLQRLISGFHH
jgi:hypothetical protein